MHTHSCVGAVRACSHAPLTHTGSRARADLFKRKTIKKWLSTKRNEDETVQAFLSPVGMHTCNDPVVCNHCCDCQQT